MVRKPTGTFAWWGSLSLGVSLVGCGADGSAETSPTVTSAGETSSEGGSSDGNATSGDGDATSGDGDGTSGDGDGDATSGDGDGTSGDGDGTSGDGDGDGTSGDGDGTSGDGDGTTTGQAQGDCGWDASDGFYECGFNGAEEPTSTHPYACPGGVTDDGPCLGVLPQGCCDPNGDLFWCDAMTNALHYIPCAGCMATGSVCTEHAQCCSGGCLATTGRCT
jgi:hypothetical protein